MERQPIRLNNFEYAKYFNKLPKFTRLQEIKMLRLAQYYDELKKRKTRKYSNSLPFVSLDTLTSNKNYKSFASLLLLIQEYKLDYKLYIEACVNMWEKGCPYPSQLTSIYCMKHYITYSLRKKAENRTERVKADLTGFSDEDIEADIRISIQCMKNHIIRRSKYGILPTDSKTEYVISNLTTISRYYLSYLGVYRIIDEGKAKGEDWYEDIRFITKYQKQFNIARETSMKLEREYKIPLGLL